MKAIDLTKLLRNKKQGWAAMSPHSTKLISHAKTLDEVLRKARKARVTNPMVFKIGQFSLPFVGA